MQEKHHYTVNVKWTGNKGTGTSDYRAYDRDHTIHVDGKHEIYGSADTPFRGDGKKYNPEDMLVSSLSTCHMLWYLHLCADAGIIVVGYVDMAQGTMETPAGVLGRFTEVVLNPIVTVTDGSMIEKANELHDLAHEKCFIANSVNFPVKHKPSCVVWGE